MATPVYINTIQLTKQMVQNGRSSRWNIPMERTKIELYQIFILYTTRWKLGRNYKTNQGICRTDRRNKTLKYDQLTINCNNIQIGTIPQSTRLQMENENLEGKIFRWKSNHVETTKPIRIVLKVEITDKEDTDRLTVAEFPATFSQFKEGIQLKQKHLNG